MSLFGRIERRAIGTTAWDVSDGLVIGGSKTASGATISHENSLRLIAVYACQSLIADSIASFPVDTFRDAGNDRVAAPKPSWLKKPNLWETPFTFWHKVVQSLVSDGNAFIATMRNASGNVVALFAVHPGMVTIEQNPDGSPSYRVQGYEDPWDRSQLLHIPAFAVAGFHRGLSPLDVAREAVGLGLTMEEYGAKFFAQGTTMSGVITHPGMPKPDEARLLREMFRKNHSGVKNAHAVGILTGGASWTNITITPENAQFLESRKFQNAQIALLYRVPAYLVDATVTSTWGSGIEEQNTNFVTMTLMPWLIRIEQAISSALLPGNVYMKFNVDARLRAKTSERYAAHAVAVNNGIKTLDEVRAEEDLPPLPNGLGSKFYRPLNMTEVGKEPDPNADKAPAPSDPNAGNVQDDPAAARAVPSVHIEPAQVSIHMPSGTTRKRIIRDEAGEIAEIVEE